MLKGDLATTGVREVLRQLADGAATGCLHVVDPTREPGEDEARVYLRAGHVYAVVVPAVTPGARPTLGARLVTSGALGPDALAEALEAQRTELQGWRLGELLVHLGYVDQPVVEAFVQEQLREATGDLLGWTSGTWRFRVNNKTREDVAPPVPVDQLLADVDRRHRSWQAIEQVVQGPWGVPVLATSGDADPQTVVDGDAWSLLCKVDGIRTLAELARDTGLTLFEAGHVVHTLVQSGLLEVAAPEADVAGAGRDAAPEPAPHHAALPVAAEVPPPSLAQAPAATVALPRRSREEARRTLLPADAAAVDSSISRVSQALSALLGQTSPQLPAEDLFAVRPARPHAAPVPVPDPQPERRHKPSRRRERDAAELAAAQAEVEAAKNDVDGGHLAEVVDLQARRDADLRVAEAEAYAEHQQRLTDELHTAETEAYAEHQQRLTDELHTAETEAYAEQARRQELLRRAEQAYAAAELRAAEELGLAEDQAYAEDAEREAEKADVAMPAQLAAPAQLSAALEPPPPPVVGPLLSALEPAPQQPDPAPPAHDVGAMAALHAAAFAELSAAANIAVEDRAPTPVLAEAEPAAEPVPVAPAPRDDLDTAALLRELSSLGLDDDAPPLPTPRPINGPARAVPAQPQKKRKGLFGRG